MRKSRIAEIVIIAGNPFIFKENGIFSILDFGIEAESRESSGLESLIIPSVERESKFDPGLHF
ncbi:MAG: hypothetical protein JXR49_10375 [Acidobacteria bacterium]|nr:hypothetical protein [Acidobacteriota bacterium]